MSSQETRQTQKIQRGDTALAVKAGFWYTVSNFLIKGIAFITTPIFARLMSDTAYGDFSNYASWQLVLMIVINAEMYNTVARAYYDFTDSFDKYVSSVTTISCVITVFFYALFLAFRGWVFAALSIPEQYIHILFITLLLSSCKNIFVARERTLYRYKSVAALSMINLVVPTLIAVLLVTRAPEEMRLSARIYGYYAPSAFLGLICAVVIYKRSRAFQWDHAKFAFKLALPMVLHYLTSYLLTSTNVIITRSTLGASSAAMVSIASSTIHLLTVLFHSLSGAVTTWLMDNLKAERFQRTRRDSLYYVALLSFAAVMVILLAPEAIWILGGARYAQANALIPGLVTAALIQACGSLLSIILTYNKRVVKTAVFTAIVAGMNITAKLLLLPAYGYIALPYINMASYAILFAVNYLLVRRTGHAKAINIKGMAAIIAPVFLAMALSGVLYANPIIRYALAAALMIGVAVVAYKYRAVLLSFIKRKDLKGKA